MFCVLIRLDAQDVVFRIFRRFQRCAADNISRSFRGKKQRCFPFWSGRKTAVKNTKQKTLRCTRLLCADGQVGGGAAAEYPVAAAARLS